MSKNSCTLKYREGEAIPPEIDLLLAQSVGNSRSVSFFISALDGSLESELYLLEELLQYLHKRRVPVRAVMPVLRVGRDPGATVRASGLVLWVDIQDKAPEEIVRLRVKCRKVIRQMAWNKGVRIGRGHWRNSLTQLVGHLERGGVTSQAKTFVKNGREDFLANRVLTNGIIQYRVGRNGVMESADVDFREEPTRLRFREVAIPKSEAHKPSRSGSRKRPPKGGLGFPRPRKPRRGADLIEMCKFGR
jgi:hypothetical protein